MIYGPGRLCRFYEALKGWPLHLQVVHMVFSYPDIRFYATIYREIIGKGEGAF